MDTFPEEICSLLERTYDISHIINLGKIEGGKMGNNYWIETVDRKYFLRGYRSDDPERIKDIHSAKKFFAGRGVSTVLPLLGKKGEEFFQYEGEIYSLFDFVDGEKIERKNLTDMHIRNMGCFLARMHIVGRKASIPLKKKEKIWNKDEFFSKADSFLGKIESKTVKDDFDLLAKKKIEFQISLASENKDKYSLNYPLILIHNDFHEENMFFDKGGDIKCIFDWEKVQLGTKAKEVGRVLEIVVFGGDYTEENFRKAKIFMEAYSKSCPISKEEFLDGVKKRYLSGMHSVWVEEEHYIRNNFRVDSFLNKEFNRIVYYSKNLDDYVNKVFDFN